MASKPVILTFVRHYLPGYRSGGPVRTIANLVERLHGEFEFRIVTSDRDATDTEPYPDAAVAKWTGVDGARVLYLPPESRSVRDVGNILRETPHDLVYLNSFFDPVFTLRPLMALRGAGFARKPVVLAPRGEFSEGAFRLKYPKKRLYLSLARVLGLHRDITWQASSVHEAEDIRRLIGPMACRVIVAPNLPSSLRGLNSGPKPRRPGDPLRVVFLSRISPMKNLDFALTVLAMVKCRVVFSIAGPVRDERHWSHCRNLIGKLRDHVQVNMLGSIPPTDVPSVLGANDLFFLPTRGENFGHAIAESLLAGTPVLISDTTPWRGLEEAGVGWDLPLDDVGTFVSCIERCATLPYEAYSSWRGRVRSFAERHCFDPSQVDANRALFMRALHGGEKFAKQVPNK